MAKPGYHKNMLYLASDHAGFEGKKEIIEYLNSQDIKFTDLGALEYDKEDDYPDFAKKLALSITNSEDRGILVCGSGQGACIVANRHKGIRAAQAWSVETAKWSRNDDDCNILCLGEKVKNIDSLIDMVKVFLDTPFDAVERRIRRINKID